MKPLHADCYCGHSCSWHGCKVSAAEKGTHNTACQREKCPCSFYRASDEPEKTYRYIRPDLVVPTSDGLYRARKTHA